MLELATNSSKYGALSVETGMLDVSCTAQDEAVTIVWTESGGPQVVTPAGPKAMEASWLNEASKAIWTDQSIVTGPGQGVVVTLKVDPDRLIK